MTRYTYKVIPAPAKGRKAPGIKGAEARFAHGLEHAINEMAAQGWDYIRADILPSEERQGLTSSTTVYRSILVFRREVSEAAAPIAAPAVAEAEDEAHEKPTFTRAAPPLTARRDTAEAPQETPLPEPEPEMPAPAEEAATDTPDTNGDDTPRG